MQLGVDPPLDPFFHPWVGCEKLKKDMFFPTQRYLLLFPPKKWRNVDPKLGTILKANVIFQLSRFKYVSFQGGSLNWKKESSFLASMEIPHCRTKDSQTCRKLVPPVMNEHFAETCYPQEKLTWQAGKSTMNEDVFHIETWGFSSQSC